MTGYQRSCIPPNEDDRLVGEVTVDLEKREKGTGLQQKGRP